ncbi:hypothetical protein ACHAWF_004065 [Thalassiosira exigua]
MSTSRNAPSASSRSTGGRGAAAPRVERGTSGGGGGTTSGGEGARRPTYPRGPGSVYSRPGMRRDPSPPPPSRLLAREDLPQEAGGCGVGGAGPGEVAGGEEGDKFRTFERWLRANGAQFPLLELRKYDSPGAERYGAEEGRGEEEDDDEAEEKKDAAETAAVAAPPRSRGSNSNAPPAEGGGDDDGSGEMRGVHASTHIPPQTVVVSIPRSCLITVEMGQQTPVGRKVLSSELDLDAPKHVFLMIYLLWDRKVRGRRSFFAPYYDVLPQTLRNMPVFWTERELAALEGSHLLAQIADRAAAIREDYRAICSVAPEFRSVATLDDFRWARMIVCSRNFGLAVGGHRTSALVPHADMLNHLRPRETKWTFCEEAQCFTITTLQGIRAGSEVYDSYGQKCNHRFLLNYGFCVERNVEADGFCPNEVPLEVGPELIEGEDDEELLEKKCAFWTRGEPGHPHHPRHPLRDEGAAAPPPGRPGYDCGGGAGPLLGTTAGGFRSSTAAPEADEAHGPPIASAAAAEAGTSSGPSLEEAPGGGRLLDPSPSGMPSGPRRPPLAATCPAKRVRVCASNNENARALFGMLRTLACDEREIDGLLAGTGRGTGAGGSSGSGAGAGGGGGGGLSPFYPPGPAAAQRLFVAAGMVPPSAGGGSPPSSSGSPRTCRDVRHPLSLRNERRALELLLEAVARQLAGYPTSLARDRADLSDEGAYPPYSNARNAKLQVRGEKEVLHHYATWARTGLEVLDVVEREAEDERAAARSAAGRGRVAGGRGGARATTTASASASNDVGGEEEEAPPGEYDALILAMEDDDDCHNTVLRYCSDVLGLVRREELERVRAEASSSYNVRAA